MSDLIKAHNGIGKQMTYNQVIGVNNMTNVTILVDKNSVSQALNTLNTVVFMMNWTLKTVTIDYTQDRAAITVEVAGMPNVSSTTTVTTFSADGVETTIVNGEFGPELVTLPKNSQVTPV